MGKGKRIFGSSLLAVGGILALLRLQRDRRKLDFNGKSVIITGGSRGLGLVLARQFAEQGADLALLARESSELDAAAEELRHHGAAVIAIPCDVGERAQVEDAMQRVFTTYGRIDVLVNNAGVIQVGPFEHMQLDDFEKSMDVHFWGPLYTTYAVLPYMRRQGGGRIVNISSIGGKVAVPHLSPYVAGKFALTGLSDALRAELAKDNILVSTINPGLMRTGSPINATFKGKQEQEYTWFSLMDASPLTSTDARKAARQIIEAARYGDPKRVITWQARLIGLVEEIAPNLFAASMRLFNRLLPGRAGSQGDELRLGLESQSGLSPSVLTALGDKAAQRNNEMRAAETREVEGVLEHGYETQV